MLLDRKAAPLYNRLAICNSPSDKEQHSSLDVREQEQIKEQELLKIRRMEQHPDQDSDNEDDPTKLLNQWLGELNTLKRVSY